MQHRLEAKERECTDAQHELEANERQHEVDTARLRVEIEEVAAARETQLVNFTRERSEAAEAAEAAAAATAVRDDARAEVSQPCPLTLIPVSAQSQTLTLNAMVPCLTGPFSVLMYAAISRNSDKRPACDERGHQVPHCT